MAPLRIGTRASALARWQANWVADRLAETSGVRPELVLITTSGDEGSPTAVVPGAGSQPGVFTKEIQRALLAGEVDLAVHSLKDLPTEGVAGLALGAVPEREMPADVLVARDGLAFAQLPESAVIGTGSLRRRANLLHARADLRLADIRGNVDTRLAKLAAGHYDAIVLAHAGLKRLGLAERVTQVLPFDLILPAVGQGALGIECRADDAPTRQRLAALNHPSTQAAVLAERELLATIGGGCLAPVGALAEPGSDDSLRLRATVCSVDGRVKLTAEATAAQSDPQALGRTVAEKLLAQGAAELIRACRGPG
ncbi:MAG: hydroxymethylbilane synthase [Planctomycetaceae bacterium]|nr:hydroxymethylbilane synthase [Planctomycetaceae bacterium]